MAEKLGQHFLNNPLIAQKIVDLLKIKTSENILEIGAGYGYLTSFIQGSGANITVIEIDSNLAEFLRKEFKDIIIIEADFLKLDIEKLKPDKICGNIPYHITGKIIEKLLRSKLQFKKIVLMMPEAVAERVTAIPGSSDYSLLSVICSLNCINRKEFLVGKDNFTPIPKIDSAVVSFIKTRDNADKYEKEFYSVVKAAFSKRRKKIRNSLAMQFSIPIEKIETILEASDISPQCRAQSVSVEKYKKLTAEFVKNGIL